MNKIEREKRVVEFMIRLYCKKKEGNESLCEDCTELLNYAHNSLNRCKFGNNKTSCKKCPIHCYKADMREKIRTVMRYSGPRMILYSPIEAIKHLFSF